MGRRAILTSALLLSCHLIRGSVFSQEPPRLDTFPPPQRGGTPEIPEMTPPPPLPMVTPRTPYTNLTRQGLPLAPGAPVIPVLSPQAPKSDLSTNQPLTQIPSPFAGPTAPAEVMVSFDPERAELQWRENRWQIWSGDVFLKDFGRYEAEGRVVLRLIREMRLTSQGTIGTPRPVMEYWLTNGEAPRGPVPGMQTIPIDLATIHTDQVQGQWCLKDHQRILFNFGASGEAARQALTVIQRHGFNQVGYVGQVAPVMLVFLASPVVQTSLTVPHGMTAAPRMVEPRFPRTSASRNAPGQRVEEKPFPPSIDPSIPKIAAAAPAIRPLTPTSPEAMGLPGARNPITTVSNNNNLSPNGAAAMGLPVVNNTERIPFDARQLQVRRQEGEWKLAAGNLVLAGFGPSEADARLAQAALRYYHCTEQVSVGSPNPVLTFYLSGGQAPRGNMLGLHPMVFRTETLQLRQTATSYILWDGNQVVMAFGDRVNDARQALAAIQQYRFDRVFRIGHGNQVLTLLARAN